jgi:hypothetical protein
MRDKHLMLFRILFAVLIICAAAAYAYFLYHPLRAALTNDYMEYRALEKEKADIAEVMLDPESVEDRIEELRNRISEMRRVGVITPATVAGDINESLGLLGIEALGLSMGAPEAPGGAVTGAQQLLALPLIIEFDSDFRSGVDFINMLEDSSAAAYVIDDFSCEITAGEDGERDEDEETDEDGAQAVKWVINVRLLYYGEL